MAFLKGIVRFFFARAEVLFDFAFGQRLNPLSWLGALGWYFFWIVAGTGIYLYIFFDTGITEAYASVEYITHEQWYLAGIARSFHRYASDALVIVVVLHLLREFSLDRLRGKRFFAWLTGIPALIFVYLCGISGYWLVWDELAQYIAIATSEWLDVLPFFAEPIANNFLNSTTLGNRFFTLMVFIHIFVPLFMLLLMWVHIQRHAQAKVNPPKPLAIGSALMLLVMSLLWPAVSQGPANLDVIPAQVGLDWFYLAAYPLLDMMPGGQLWLVLVGAGLLLAFLPWLPPEKKKAAAVVSLENCNGCARCYDDCPFSAISMLPRSDGRGYKTEAVVNADNCMSCGICVGSCPTATPFRRASAIVPGIELPEHRIADLRERTIAASEHSSQVDVCSSTAASTPVLRLWPQMTRRSLRCHASRCCRLLSSISHCHETSRMAWPSPAVRSVIATTGSAATGCKCAWMESATRTCVDVLIVTGCVSGGKEKRTSAPGALHARNFRTRSPNCQKITRGANPMSRARRIPAAGYRLYAVCCLRIVWFATRPAYQYGDAAKAEIKLSLSHATNRVAPCVPLTQEQIAELAANMRRTEACERERLPLVIELHIDGERIIDLTAAPIRPLE